MANNEMDNNTKTAARQRTIAEYREGKARGDYFAGDDEGALRVGFASGWDAHASVGEWVAVETLPEREGNYLCVSGFGDDPNVWHSVLTFRNGRFIGDGYVIAWREIPPYTGEQK